MRSDVETHRIDTRCTPKVTHPEVFLTTAAPHSALYPYAAYRSAEYVCAERPFAVQIDAACQMWLVPVQQKPFIVHNDSASAQSHHFRAIHCHQLHRLYHLFFSVLQSSPFFFCLLLLLFVMFRSVFMFELSGDECNREGIATAAAAGWWVKNSVRGDMKDKPSLWPTYASSCSANESGFSCQILLHLWKALMSIFIILIMTFFVRSLLLADLHVARARANFLNVSILRNWRSLNKLEMKHWAHW